MNKIGIMQGRVLPDQMEVLQVFPERWEEELSVIKKIGFDLVELLADKNHCFINILEKNPDLFLKKIKDNGLGCVSVCMDYLCNYSLIKNEKLFFKELDKVVGKIKGDNFIFVIPFFDENKLSGAEELNDALKLLSKYENLLGTNKFSLEIDLPAEIVKQEIDKFNLQNIGICYDFGNRMGLEADLEKEISLLSEYINHVHIKYKDGGKNVRIEKKSAQFKKGFLSLEKIKYDGVMILETCVRPVPETEAKMNLSTVREYIKG